MVVEADGRAKAAMRATSRIKSGPDLSGGKFGGRSIEADAPQSVPSPNANLQMLCGALETVCLTFFLFPSRIEDRLSKRDNVHAE